MPASSFIEADYPKGPSVLDDRSCAVKVKSGLYFFENIFQGSIIYLSFDLTDELF